MKERETDALLRSDLRKICAMSRGFGRDSLLLAAVYSGRYPFTNSGNIRSVR